MKKEFISRKALKEHESRRIFRDLEMVEYLGSGIPRILKVYPKESFIFLDNFTRMIFYTKKSIYDITQDNIDTKLGEKLGEKLNKNQQSIIQIITNNPYTTINDLSKKIGISSTAIENNIRKLKDKKLISRIGADKGGYWKILRTSES